MSNEKDLKPRQDIIDDWAKAQPLIHDLLHEDGKKSYVSITIEIPAEQVLFLTWFNRIYPYWAKGEPLKNSIAESLDIKPKHSGVVDAVRDIEREIDNKVQENYHTLFHGIHWLFTERKQPPPRVENDKNTDKIPF